MSREALPHPHWQRTTPFLEATTPAEEADQVIIGVPLDHTTSFRPGTREAPRRVRDVSDGIESFSPMRGAALEERRIADLGDLMLPWGDVRGALDIIEAAVHGALQGGRRPVIIGGEHLLTLGAVRAAVRRWPDLAVVQLDAHLDLRDEYAGLPLSHATVLRRVSELVGLERLVQLGVRSGIREEWELWRRTWRVDGSLVEAARRLSGELRGRPFYLTIDIDVTDPAFAPGTGTPEPGGPSAGEVLEAVGLLASAGPVAVDLVEVCPVKDPSDITSLLAAKLLREVLVAGPAAPSRPGQERVERV